MANIDIVARFSCYPILVVRRQYSRLRTSTMYGIYLYLSLRALAALLVVPFGLNKRKSSMKRIIASGHDTAAQRTRSMNLPKLRNEPNTFERWSHY